ncbi:MAG TPA: hypothetical protein VFJ16_31130 [Longimicrobium sp.]|nr:hypothetical protein [Longimicrobium sp.]
MPLNLSLAKLANQASDAEQGCYLMNGKVAATDAKVPVLQHCVLVDDRHRNLWQPQTHYVELTSDGKEGATTSWEFTADLGNTIKRLSVLSDGEAFVDLNNFEGDYYPYVMDGDRIHAAGNYAIRDTKKNKSLALYFLEKGGVLRTFVLYVESRGFGMGDIGAARTDPASEIAYAWWGNRAFGYALGLDLARHAGNAPSTFSNTATDSQHRVYYRCSDPGLAHAASSATVYPTTAEAVIYKRFKGEAEGLYASDANVSDSGTKVKKKNRPHLPNGVRLVALLSRGTGLSSAYKTGIAKKRKGRELEEDEGAETLTGVAAGILISKSGTGRDTMPKAPTTRANELVQASKTARDFLATRGIGLAAGNTLRTDQEWCHLLASSLTGTEEFYNFVLGSKHCNSEQLAIETALLFSLKAVHRAERRLKVKITAYVVPGTDLLLGDVIRYKVLMTKEGAADRLLLDHLIDAQSESFSFLEYRVLQETVRRLIAIELGSTHVAEYEKRLNERITELNNAGGGGGGLVYSVNNVLKTAAETDDDEEDDDEDDLMDEGDDDEDQDEEFDGDEEEVDDQDVTVTGGTTTGGGSAMEDE